MKITFEFDTDSENFDNQELERYKAVDDVVYTLNKVYEQIREWYKYDTRGSIPISEVWDTLTSIINEVNLEKLGY